MSKVVDLNKSMKKKDELSNDNDAKKGNKVVAQ